MEHHYHHHHHANSSTRYNLMWKLQSENIHSFRSAPPPLFLQEWPPRSYSCSFCRREFRSAQALGGHMNVHRRDRAKLKQSPPPQLTITKPSTTKIMFAPPPPPPLRKESERRWGDDEEEEYSFVERGAGDVINVCKRHKLMYSSMEEIDLELRLGASTTVKVAQIS